MQSLTIHLFTTKNDLCDIIDELQEFAHDNKTEIHFPGDASKAQIAIFVLSQFASDDCSNSNFEAYLKIIEQCNANTKYPAIYLFVRSELHSAFRIWEKGLNQRTRTWLENNFKSIEFKRNLLLGGLNDNFYNEHGFHVRELLKSMHKLTIPFLHTDDDGKFVKLRRRHALLLFLFILNHLLNRTQTHSNNWISPFYNILDLKENLKYALFPPKIVVDFQKALVSNGIPILAITLQRYEQISHNQLEFGLEVVNAGKSPVFMCNSRIDDPLQIFYISDKKEIQLLTTEKFVFGFPPVLGPGERRGVRVLIPVLRSEYILIFHYRCVQSFNVKCRFNLKLQNGSHNHRLVFLDINKE